MKHSFEMKKVTKADVKQYDNLLRYVFQVTNRDLTQYGRTDEEVTKDKELVFNNADVIGWFDNDLLVSQLAIYHLKVSIFGRIYQMGGLTSVGTFPEYSNRGLMKKLVYHALLQMKENNQSISYLYPYSIPYYRKKGWEIISNKISYEIADYQLPVIKTVVGEVVRVAADSQVVREAYNKFATKTHGALIREKLAWNEYFRWNQPNLTAAVFHNQADEVEGCLIYSIANDIFFIKEMIFMSEDARMALWNFVSAHFSMIKKVVGTTYTDEPLAFLFEDADIKETITPYYMARIVDVVSFIEQYPFKADSHERSWVFNLVDPILDWNNGTFKLTIAKNGNASIAKIVKKTNDTIDIQTLTTMLLGYKRPEYLYQIRRIRALPKTIDMLEDAIEQQSSYFSDYF